MRVWKPWVAAKSPGGSEILEKFSKSLHPPHIVNDRSLLWNYKVNSVWLYFKLSLSILETGTFVESKIGIISFICTSLVHCSFQRYFLVNPIKKMIMTSKFEVHNPRGTVSSPYQISYKEQRNETETHTHKTYPFGVYVSSLNVT